MILDRVNKYCDGLIESAWLLVLIVTPLFFMMDSFRTFEAPKIYVFQSIILLALAAWAIKGISHVRPGFLTAGRAKLLKQFHDLPIPYPVLGLPLVYLISTFFSLSPRTSLWGTYVRIEGAIPLITYLLLFVIMTFNLRAREQINRLVAVLALVCFAIDVYAVLQHIKLDPFSFLEADTSVRAISTIGHPIFTAVFLGMAFFIILSKSILSFHSFLLKRESRVGDLILSVLYSLVCLSNLVAFWFTGSRGPLLGLLSGMACFILLILLYWRMRRALYAILAAGAVLLSLLVVLNIPSGPLASVRDAPMIGPLGHLFDVGAGTGQTRVLIWQGMAQLNMPHAPLLFPDQTADRWNSIRWLVGYGPDVIKLAYEGFYNPQSYILESPTVIYDRSHNRFWDVFGFYGLLGFLAEYGLFLSLFFYTLRWLSLFNTVGEQKFYWILSVAGGLVGVFVPLLFSKPEYIGLTAHLGLLAGLVGTLVYRVIRPFPGLQSHPLSWQAITMIGLLAALVSHYVELSSGISTFTSRILFWACAAILLVIGRMMVGDQESETDISGAHFSIRNGWVQVGINSSILGLLIITFGSRFLVDFRIRPDAATTLANALTSIPAPTPYTSYGILAMLISTLVVGSFLLQLEGDALNDHGPNWKNIFATAGFVLVFSVLLLLLRAYQITGLIKSISTGDSTALVIGLNWLTSAVFITLFLFFLLMGFALAISGHEPTDQVIMNPLAYIGMASLAALVLIPIVKLNLRPLQADVLYATVVARTKSGDYSTATSIYERLLAMEPAEPDYQNYAGKLYGDMIINTTNANEKEQYFQSGLELLKAANTLEPLLASNQIALAHFYQQGGDMSSDPAQRNVRFLLANTYYAAALKIKPSRIDYWLEWANFCALKGDIPCASDKINSALAVNDSADQIYEFSGQLFAVYASSLTDQVARTEAFNKALKAYQTEAELITRKGGNPVVAFLGIGNVSEALKQYELARAAFLQAAQLSNDQDTWQIYKRIATLSSFMGEKNDQRGYLQKALELAPEDQKASLRDELNKLAP